MMTDTLSYNCKSQLSNADKIRAMSDEELAEWLGNFVSSNAKQYAKARCSLYRGRLAEWLKQESRDESNARRA